jgi:hypothetical protein
MLLRKLMANGSLFYTIWRWNWFPGGILSRVSNSTFFATSEFDELSVVEEEPEELSNEDERHHRSEERIEHPEERHNRCEVEEPERIEPERPVTVPDIQISNVDGDGSSGVEGRKDGGCSGGQNCPGVERPIGKNCGTVKVPVH